MAERRLKSNKFPWPEWQKKLSWYLNKHPEFFAQTGGSRDEILSNLEGEVKTYGLEEFYNVMINLDYSEMEKK